MDFTFSFAIWKRLTALSEENSLSTAPLVYNFVECIGLILHSDGHQPTSASFTVIVVVSNGPLKM
jgi:hypothetical protein